MAITIVPLIVASVPLVTQGCICDSQVTWSTRILLTNQKFLIDAINKNYLGEFLREKYPLFHFIGKPCPSFDHGKWSMTYFKELFDVLFTESDCQCVNNYWTFHWSPFTLPWSNLSLMTASRMHSIYASAEKSCS